MLFVSTNRRIVYSFVTKDSARTNYFKQCVDRILHTEWELSIFIGKPNPPFLEWEISTSRWTVKAAWWGGMPVICENLADQTRTRWETKGRAAVWRLVGPRVHSEPRYARGGGHSESGECRGSSAFQRQSADPLVALLLLSSIRWCRPRPLSSRYQLQIHPLQ